MNAQRPEAVGLYDPTFEHDACGVGAVADLSGAASHATVARALQVLDALEHRGASGAEIDTGDGAGILLQLPDAFLRAAVDFELPPSGSYAVGMCFLPKDPVRRRELEALIERTAKPRSSNCSAGATCRWTPTFPARAPRRWSPSSARCSWARAG